MTTKTTCAEFKLFYGDESWWPEGTWHEDQEVCIDYVPVDNDFDLSSVPDATWMTLAGGFVTNENGDDLGSFESYFRKWRKHQSTVFLSVEVDRDKEHAVRAAISAAGGKVK